MANIGDLFYTFRGDGTRLQSDAKKEGEKAADAGSKSFAGRFKSGVSKAFSGAKGGILGGLGLGVGLGAVGLATEALSKLQDVMAESVQAAIEEEKSVSKLDAALRANVKGYDGNSEAIEKVLASRMRLGYADDEQRESLATLVAVTKDHTKALALQRTAMDLARLRNISLQAASDILGKVYGGNIGILSRYGIQIRKGATATEALAEITKLAAGQAEAFAQTNEGKLLASQIKVGEAMEKLGARILPFVAAGTEGAAEAVETLVLGLDALGDVLDIITTAKLPETQEEAFELTDALLGLAGLLPGFGSQAAQWGQDVATEMNRVAANADYMADATKDDLRVIAGEAGDMADEVDEAGEVVERSFRDILTAATETVQGLIDGYFDPIETRAGIYKSRMEQNAAEERLRDATTAREKREASDDIIDAIDDQASALVDLANQGDLTANDIDHFEEDVKASYKALGKEVPKEIQAIIEKLRALDKWDGHTVNVKVKQTNIGYAGPGKGGVVPRATGGQVARGKEYVWSEPRRPELFLPDVSGRIAAMPEIRAAVGAGAPAGGERTFNINVIRPDAPDPFDIADQLARVEDFYG